MNTMIFESWLEEEARLEQERALFWRKVREQLMLAGAGILLLGVFFVIAWIGTAFND